MPLLGNNSGRTCRRNDRNQLGHAILLQEEFDILDKSISEIRIVLLVQIGKEGWDCRSLTCIILSPF